MLTEDSNWPEAAGKTKAGPVSCALWPWMHAAANERNPPSRTMDAVPPGPEPRIPAHHRLAITHGHMRATENAPAG
jgi:hypothetical protein